MKGKRFFCFILLIVSFNCVFFAKDKDSMSLFEIDKLIRKTEYNEALKQLNIYMENNPDQFDNVQTRISKIMNAKIRYSELYEEYVDVVLNDPTNDKRIYEITAELERFERNPTSEELKQISKRKELSEFRYFQSLSTEIQEKMAQYNNEQKYVAAIKEAQTGFWLYKENFYIKWEDYPEIISGVEKIVNDLNSHLEKFENKDFTSDINKAVTDFVKDVNKEQYDAALKKFSLAKQQLSKLQPPRLSGNLQPHRPQICGTSSGERGRHCRSLPRQRSDGSGRHRPQSKGQRKRPAPR